MGNMVSPVSRNCPFQRREGSKFRCWEAKACSASAVATGTRNSPPQLEQYGEYSPLFLLAKPGITGYWPVNGRSEVTDFSHRTALDIQYIRDQSLKTDFEVLLKTIPAVLLRRGAF
jgi:lipopolysaccharide/colanic/teichoic acid biosynthesis glycosyltransferase